MDTTILDRAKKAEIGQRATLHAAHSKPSPASLNHTPKTVIGGIRSEMIDRSVDATLLPGDAKPMKRILGVARAATLVGTSTSVEEFAFGAASESLSFLAEKTATMLGVPARIVMNGSFAASLALDPSLLANAEIQVNNDGTVTTAQGVTYRMSPDANLWQKDEPQKDFDNIVRDFIKRFDSRFKQPMEREICKPEP